MTALTWIQAARPRTLIIAFSPVVIGSVAAFSEGHFRFYLMLITLISALCIQIGTNLANDYFDFIKGADTSSRVGPTRVTQAGLISPEKVKKGFITAFALAALFGSYLIWEGGILFAIGLPISIALGILYTAGKYSLAYLGIADAFVFLFFGPFATLGTYTLQTQQLSLDAFLIGMGPGALAWAIFLINNLRDIEEDQKAGKMTLCVRVGRKLGKALYLGALFIALFTPLIWSKEHPFVLLTSLLFFLAFPLALAVFNEETPSGFNPLFKKSGALILLYTLLFSAGWLL